MFFGQKLTNLIPAKKDIIGKGISIVAVSMAQIFSFVAPSSEGLWVWKNLVEPWAIYWTMIFDQKLKGAEWCKFQFRI